VDFLPSARGRETATASMNGASNNMAGENELKSSSC
jgi:hypothetical protein